MNSRKKISARFSVSIVHKKWIFKNLFWHTYVLNKCIWSYFPETSVLKLGFKFFCFFKVGSWEGKVKRKKKWRLKKINKKKQENNQYMHSISPPAAYQEYHNPDSLFFCIVTKD